MCCQILGRPQERPWRGLIVHQTRAFHGLETLSEQKLGVPRSWPTGARGGARAGKASTEPVSLFGIPARPRSACPERWNVESYLTDGIGYTRTRPIAQLVYRAALLKRRSRVQIPLFHLVRCHRSPDVDESARRRLQTFLADMQRPPSASARTHRWWLRNAEGMLSARAGPAVPCIVAWHEDEP